MIEDFRSLAVFNTVADLGSFTAAARHLKLSTSVVSHHISKLEGKLGVSLFFRSTRSLSLTPEGQLIRDAARRMVDAGEEALDALSDHAHQPVGTLRLSLPAFHMDQAVQSAIWGFAKAHPMMALSLNSDDRQVDLVKDGFDLAIRLGTLSDSSLKSRKIASFDLSLVAAPDYVAQRGGISSVEDLKRCEFVALSMVNKAVEMRKGAQKIRFTPDKIRLEVDNITAGKSAVMAGLGVQRLPISEVRADVDAGRLVRLLPQWQLPSLGIYAVWPDIGPQKNLTRRLIDYLSQTVKA